MFNNYCSKREPTIELEEMMDRVFDPALTETELVDLLPKKEYRKIGAGFSTHVFAATDMSVVLKIFPQLNVGGPEDVEFINTNWVLRYAEVLTARWQRFCAVKWIRQKVKLLVALYRSSENIRERENLNDLDINGYDICLKKGLMKRLPTRIIPNCVTQLSLHTSQRLRSHFEKPDKMVLQKRFQDGHLLINVLKHFACKADIKRCNELIEQAINYQVYLWEAGVADTDMSFNIFENLIVLSDWSMQIHDANDITDSFSSAVWFIREKEKDIEQISREIYGGGYTATSFLATRRCISETAQKLLGILPREHREGLVMLFIARARDILSEEIFVRSWNKVLS